VRVLEYLFNGGAERLDCLDAGDSDDSGTIDISDAVYLLDFLFLGGPPPPPPVRVCGIDRTADALACGAHSACPAPVAIAVGDEVSLDVPADGAGSIETPGARDFYTFTARPLQTLVFEGLDTACCAIEWECYDAFGAAVFERRAFGTENLGPIRLDEGGEYVIVVSGRDDVEVGSYSFRLVDGGVASYLLGVGDIVSEDAPESGAGTISAPGERDAYVFTAGVGERVYFGELESACCDIVWQCSTESGEQVFASNPLGDSRDPGAFDLAGGTYTIEVRAQGDATGAYSFELDTVPSPDEASIELDTDVFGAIEVRGVCDVYTFDAPAGTVIYVEELHVAGFPIAWACVDEGGEPLFADDNFLLNDVGELTLTRGGTYTITVCGRRDATGTYAFRLHTVAAPDAFEIAIGDVVSPGVPGAGAGVIEAVAVLDVYTFTAASGTTVYFSEQDTACCSFRWVCVDEGGARVFGENPLAEGRDVGERTLERGGEYTITVRAIRTDVGQYSFAVEAR